MVNRSGNDSGGGLKAIARSIAAAGLLAIAIGIGLLVLPLRAGGATGNAIRPHFVQYQLAVGGPQDLENPVDIVQGRRLAAGLLIAVGVAASAGGLIAVSQFRFPDDAARG